MTRPGGPPAAAGDRGEDDVLHADTHLRITWSAADSSLIVSGEVDVSNCAALTAALGAVKDVLGEVVVDTGDLRFIDLAGLRALLMPGPAPGGAVHLRNVPPYLRRLLDMLGHLGEARHAS
ncbi:STAS domain-containing protein [Microbispora sp. NPDC049125]|uniref:STAS domain-containing protein n=1 Tax=Microbispora sp. NPDC049125 TaxID=3154929 RepID=UPI003465CC0C